MALLYYLNVSLNDRGYPSWSDSIHGNDGPGLVRDGARVGARTSRRKFLSTKVFDNFEQGDLYSTQNRHCW